MDAVRSSVRPLKIEVDIEIEPLRVLNIERCSTIAEDRPIELDRDLAKPLTSELVRPREPARVLNRVR